MPDIAFGFGWLGAGLGAGLALIGAGLGIGKLAGPAMPVNRTRSNTAGGLGSRARKARRAACTLRASVLSTGSYLTKSMSR